MRKLWLLTLVISSHVLAQSPVVYRISPLGIPPGRTTEVKLVGERLGEITDVWTSVAEAKIVYTNGPTLNITLPKSSAGIGALRVVTTNGASELAIFMIDDLPTTSEARTNKSVATAQSVRKPIAVDGTTDELAFDYYAFEAKKGENTSLDVVASRIGSKLDPVLRVVDAKSHELVFCEDARGVGRDCRIHFRAPATAQYLAEVRDIAYQGGAQYFYRLRVGKIPFATCTYPLAAKPGTELTVLGPPGEQFKPAKVSMPAAPYATVMDTFVAVHAADIESQQFEREPDDKREQATQIVVPGIINGRFETGDDRDWFVFNAEKDQRWVFATHTRSLGSPCDVFLEVRDSEGKIIAASNPSGPEDTTLTNQFKESGRYFLIAKELADGGAPDFAYQIDAKLFEPGFTMAVDDDKIEAKAGGETSLPVSCARFDFSDKITVEFEGLPEGFTLEGATIDAKKTNTTVKIKVPDTATPGKLVTFKVLGVAGEKRVKASTIAALRKTFPLMLYPPGELDGIVALGITAQPPAPEPKRRRT